MRSPGRSNEPRRATISGPRELSVRVNGELRTGLAAPRLTLADFLRDELGLTGTHLGCEHGVCGACMILYDGETVRACLMLAVQAEGAELMTVEGLTPVDGALHPIQRAFAAKHGLQCGFCTPGFLMTVLELLESEPDPSEARIRGVLSGNLCGARATSTSSKPCSSRPS